MKTWAISDTHRQHRFLNIPDNIDLIIHAGDSTNYYDWLNNQPEFEDFIKWFSELPIKYKVLIAGNKEMVIMVIIILFNLRNRKYETTILLSYNMGN